MVPPVVHRPATQYRIEPIGNGIEKFKDAIYAGKSGAGMITAFDASEFTSKIAAQVNDFEASDYLSPKEVRRSDRFVQFAIAAASMAVEDSKIDLQSVDPYRF